MVPSIYINLEDDVSRIVTRLKREKAEELVLVCPKRCFLFNDSINLRLLKKQVDLLKKNVSILTMDEKGQTYAKEAGFEIKFLPKNTKTQPGFSDINLQKNSEEVHAEPRKTIALKKKTDSEPKAPAKIVKGKTKLASMVPSVTVSDHIFPSVSKEVHFEETKNSSHKALWVFLVLTIISALTVFFVVLPKADIIITPKSESLVRELEITFAESVKEVDAVRLVIPALKVSQTLEAQGKFQSQGKKSVGNPSSGSIKIYNFTGSPINLKANTTTLKVGSKSYTLSSDIVLLPPTKYKNSTTKEIDEQSLGEPVEIVAIEGGEDYNIPAGTRIEISNQVFGSRPQVLYAKAYTAITGGTTRYLSFVSEQDISKAQESLSLKALASLNEELQKSGSVLIEKSYTYEVTEFKTDKPAGTQTPNFEATLKLKIEGLTFKTEDLQKVVSERVGQTLSLNKELSLPSESKIEPKVKTLDLSTSYGVLSTRFEGKAWYKLELSDLSKDLVGKSPEEVNSIISKGLEVERVDITLAPSWQKQMPWWKNKIEVSTQKN